MLCVARAESQSISHTFCMHALRAICSTSTCDTQGLLLYMLRSKGPRHDFTELYACTLNFTQDTHAPHHGRAQPPKARLKLDAYEPPPPVLAHATCMCSPASHAERSWSAHAHAERSRPPALLTSLASTPLRTPRASSSRLPHLTLATRALRWWDRLVGPHAT